MVINNAVDDRIRKSFIDDGDSNTTQAISSFGSIYKLIKFDPNDSQPTYIGLNQDADAVDGDADWKIYKFTYDGSDTTQIQVKYGSWTGRTLLF